LSGRAAESSRSEPIEQHDEAAMARAVFQGRTGPWFTEQVRAGGRWDYKRPEVGGGLRFEEFGNFHYGAVGQKAGFSRLAVAAGSLFAHANDNGWRALTPKHIVNEARDQIIVQRGYTHAANGCK
jgi:hypothetical protein